MIPPVGANHSLTYRLTREDLLDACRLHDLGVVLGWRMLAGVGLYTAGVAALLLTALRTLFTLPLAGLVGFGLALFLSIALLVLRHALLPLYLVRRQLRERPRLSSDWAIEISEQGYAVRGETGSSDVNWRHYVQWRENARTILLYQSWQSYQFIPKRILPPGAATFVLSRLRSAGVRDANLLLSRRSPD